MDRHSIAFFSSNHLDILLKEYEIYYQMKTNSAGTIKLLIASNKKPSKRLLAELEYYKPIALEIICFFADGYCYKI